MKRYPHELSGGQMQRVMIAMAMAMKPKLLIADEITTALDANLKNQILDLVLSLVKELKIAVLLISHDLHVVMSATDYVVCLNGHICCSGTPKTVANNHNYKELFGDRASNTLSIYEHKHDHTHSTDGTIKTKKI